MKLLLCLKCQDIFNLSKQVKSCSCGQASGKYLADGWHAVFSGEFSVPMGFSNPSMVLALNHWSETGSNPDFTAFFIERKCPTFKEVDDVENYVEESSAVVATDKVGGG